MPLDLRYIYFGSILDFAELVACSGRTHVKYATNGMNDVMYIIFNSTGERPSEVSYRS